MDQFGALFGLYGLIHAIGFAATWRLGQTTMVSARPTYPAELAVGRAPVQGLLWVVALAGFLAVTAGLALATPWSRGLAAGAAVLSLAVFLAWWNDAQLGALVDVAILIGLAVTTWVVRPVRA